MSAATVIRKMRQVAPHLAGLFGGLIGNDAVGEVIEGALNVAIGLVGRHGPKLAAVRLREIHERELGSLEEDMVAAALKGYRDDDAIVIAEMDTLPYGIPVQEE